MKLIYILCLGFILSGCATKQDIQKVYLPVSTKCYDKPLPIKPKLSVDNTSDDIPEPDMIINNLTTDIDKLEVYSSELLTFICK